MFRDLREQLRVERQKNELLAAQNQKLQADVAYIAMMADVDMEDDEEEENYE